MLLQCCNQRLRLIYWKQDSSSALSKQKIDIQMDAIDAMDASRLTICQESISMNIVNAANLNFFRGFSNGSKNFFKVSILNQK